MVVSVFRQLVAVAGGQERRSLVFERLARGLELVRDMGSRILFAFVLGVICVSILGSVVTSKAGSRARDECNPSTYVVRCGEQPGARRACVKVNRDDYLLGVGREHHEVATVTCPGGAPLCVERSGRGVCRAK
jgi:hypothetical protein